MNDTIIKIEGLSKIFNQNQKNEVVALKDISLDIKRGDIFGIIGLSGAGKSTLVRCINLLERPTEGKIIFQGKDLCSVPHSEVLKARRSMSMIFQSFNLLEQRTAIKNVCFPLEVAGVPKKEAMAKAMELLELVGLSDRINSYPSQLSGGQKQRVAIARALATDPEVLLCDEATSALDPNTTKQILELLKSINEKLGVTIIVITHEMKVIEKICNKIAVIDHSNIVETGEVREVFFNPRSDIARQLIVPDESAKIGNDSIRLVFDGESSNEPIVSNMILETGAPANILFAKTNIIDGKVYGQMVIKLPDDRETAKKMLSFLDSHKVSYEKEDSDND
ncbi:MAG: ATP-binding cassette domain-containing protein [Ruminococcaceae bacterium]|nr:ATP-binding cassette domain-containing protein [Oscillospiraceae bacterium]